MESTSKQQTNKTYRNFVLILAVCFVLAVTAGKYERAFATACDPTVQTQNWNSGLGNLVTALVTKIQVAIMNNLRMSILNLRFQNGQLGGSIANNSGLYTGMANTAEFQATYNTNTENFANGEYSNIANAMTLTTAGSLPYSISQSIGNSVQTAVYNDLIAEIQNMTDIEGNPITPNTNVQAEIQSIAEQAGTATFNEAQDLVTDDTVGYQQVNEDYADLLKETPYMLTQTDEVMLNVGFEYQATDGATNSLDDTISNYTQDIQEKSTAESTAYGQIYSDAMQNYGTAVGNWISANIPQMVTQALAAAGLTVDPYDLTFSQDMADTIAENVVPTAQNSAQTYVSQISSAVAQSSSDFLNDSSSSGINGMVNQNITQTAQANNQLNSSTQGSTTNTQSQWRQWTNSYIQQVNGGVAQAQQQALSQCTGQISSMSSQQKAQCFAGVRLDPTKNNTDFIKKVFYAFEAQDVANQIENAVKGFNNNTADSNVSEQSVKDLAFLEHYHMIAQSMLMQLGPMSVGTTTMPTTLRQGASNSTTGTTNGSLF